MTRGRGEKEKHQIPSIKFQTNFINQSAFGPVEKDSYSHSAFEKGFLVAVFFNLQSEIRNPKSKGGFYG